MKRILSLMLVICTIMMVFSACTDITLDTDVQPPSSAELSDTTIEVPDEPESTDNTAAITQQPVDTQPNETEKEPPIPEETEETEEPQEIETIPPEIEAPEPSVLPVSSTFSIHFIDVGQADAALVECDGH